MMQTTERPRSFNRTQARARQRHPVGMIKTIVAYSLLIGSGLLALGMCLAWSAASTGPYVPGEAQVMVVRSKTIPNALHYFKVNETLTPVWHYRLDGSSYVIHVMVEGPAEQVPYKINWLGAVTWSEKPGKNWVARRDPSRIIGLREDGTVVWKSTP